MQNILKALGGGNSRKIPSIESIQDLNFIEFILDIPISAVVQLWPQSSNIYFISFIYHLSLFISQQKLGIDISYQIKVLEIQWVFLIIIRQIQGFFETIKQP